MSFPAGPTNGQIFELDDIEYEYIAAQGVWRARAAQTSDEITYNPENWILGGTPGNVKEAIDSLSQAALFSGEGVSFRGFFDPTDPPADPIGPGLGDWYQIDPSGSLAGAWPTDTEDITNATAMTQGDIVRYDGTAWRLISVGGGGATSLGDLSDVSVGSAVNGHYLRFNGTSWQGGFISWFDIISLPTFVEELADLSDWPASLNDLSDVNASITNESLLYKKAGNYVGSGAHNAGDLIYFDGTDWVALRPPVSPSEDQVLIWNGTTWEFRDVSTTIGGTP